MSTSRNLVVALLRSIDRGNLIKKGRVNVIDSNKDSPADLRRDNNRRLFKASFAEKVMEHSFNNEKENCSPHRAS